VNGRPTANPYLTAGKKRPSWRKRLWKTVHGYPIRTRSSYGFLGGYLPPRLYVPQAVAIERRYGPIRNTVTALRPILQEVVRERVFEDLDNFLKEYLDDLGITRRFINRRDDRTRTDQDYYQLILSTLQREVNLDYQFIGTVPRRDNVVTALYRRRIAERAGGRRRFSNRRF